MTARLTQREPSLHLPMRDADERIALADALRNGAMRDAAAGGLHRLLQGLSAIGRALASFPARRRAYDDLMTLTARELADIGLTREDIPRVFDPDFVPTMRVDTVAKARLAHRPLAA